MNVQRFRIFPTLVYDVECEEIGSDVLKVFDKVKWSTEDPNMSKSNHVLSKHKLLTKNIEKIVNDALAEINYQFPMKMTSSWFTRTPKGNAVKPHYHTNSFWSAVFYFQENCSALIFEKKSYQIHVPYCPKSIDTIIDGALAFTANQGHMLLFPSFITHLTGVNTELEERYSLAMNFMPIGNINTTDSSYNYQ
jgi:uncharacterized protein (TIGR02466 family)